MKIIFRRKSRFAARGGFDREEEIVLTGSARKKNNAIKYTSF